VWFLAHLTVPDSGGAESKADGSSPALVKQVCKMSTEARSDARA